MSTRRPDWRITHYSSLPSTSDVVLARIRGGDAAPGDVVVAALQTAGRGRQGRSWVSEPGGLWLTAALPVGSAPFGQPALVAAVAACEAVQTWVPEAGVKWPNDLLVRDRKVGGILVERLARAELAAVGIGINVACRPTDGELANSAGALIEFAASPLSPEDLLPVLLDALGRRWEEWLGGGWPALRDAWRGMDAARGRSVRVEPPGVEGLADGIDDRGALRVRLPDGSVSVASVGEVSFL
jgi:BirA family transcriptional regulator, biotin operon repressor / biotin---[acetyl-CoA-carboxylase] ligase